MSRHRIGIIGLGKIAHDQHLPVITKSADFELAAIVSRRGLTVQGVPTFGSAADMYAAVPELDVVALCTPPGAHFQGARGALEAGKHVLLEKPPTIALSGVASVDEEVDEGAVGVDVAAVPVEPADELVAAELNSRRQRNVMPPASSRFVWQG